MKELVNRLVTDITRAWQVDETLKGGQWRVVSLTLPCASTPALDSVLEWNTGVQAVYSAEPVTRMERVGLGAAAVVQGFGSDAMGVVRTEMNAARLPSGSTWFGGFAFDPTIEPRGIWQGWPHAMWFVPKLLLVRAFDSDVVRVSYIDKAGQTVEDITASLKGMLRPAASTHMSEIRFDASTTLESNDVIHDEETWAAVVNRALVDIRAGRMDKVVLGRQARMTVTATLSDSLSRLRNAYETSHVFAMHWNGVWMLGASPEELVRAGGGAITVDCLAGTTARGIDAETDRQLAKALLTSEKNRSEHGAVVRFVTERLRLVANELEWPDVPTIKQLANVQHLYTPVRGRLQNGKQLLDAAALLHPTPAVGGTPRADALTFIREHEGWPRGFYAGGFGLIDGTGNGLVNVALRTAAVRFPEARLFAGCGIVDGSRPADEWLETEMKLKPMRMALQ
ncbi:isochorismate synthase [Alicyclobacillus dauci]|uniref:isochorismate synthase n=1 Tax=Alicyclobacillus dauci TaxID=1475485 RepID=A0ABY6Z7C7_9BACL|nr:isochorismate synthase [Alicyclobacillus dauci]WAH38791.1 isochorismate synthase [Alicyclobacillus dauci]